MGWIVVWKRQNTDSVTLKTNEQNSSNVKSREKNEKKKIEPQGPWEKPNSIICMHIAVSEREWNENEAEKYVKNNGQICPTFEENYDL